MEPVVNQSMLEAAIAYLGQRRSVIPLHEIIKGECSCGKKDCPSAGKHVRLKEWKIYQERLPTRDEVERWWKKWPRSNLGIVMGKVSGLFGVDCDNDDKVAWIYEVIGKPDTEIHLSAKGPHYLFLYPEDQEIPTVLIGPKVEVKGEGSQMVAPPSTHQTGHIYRFEEPRLEPASAPQALMDEIQNAHEFQRGARLTADELEEMLRGQEVGDRHPTMRSLVGRWVAKGITLPEIEVAALGWNSRNIPPKPEKAIIEQVRDMYNRWADVDAPDLPLMNHEGDEFEFIWPKAGVNLSAKYLQEVHDGLQAEIWIRNSGGITLHWGRLKLASTSGRKDVVDKLRKINGEIDWQEILEYACRIVTEEYRAGEPIQELKPAVARKTQYLIENFLPLGETTVLFADGGTGKSTLALALGLSVVSGHPLPSGLRPLQQTNVLYLDWESNIEEHEDRLMALKNGMGIQENGGFYYRRCFRPIDEEVNLLKAEAQKLNVGMVIIDSFGPAASMGGDFTETGVRTMNAIRQFAPATRLLLTHIPGYDARGTGNGKARPIGSVYVNNLARATWYMQQSEEDPEFVGLYNDKANRGKKRPPIGLRMSYSEDEQSLVISNEEVLNNEELSKRVTLGRRVLHHLLKAGPTTAEDIAIALDAKDREKSVRKSLERMEKQHKVMALREEHPQKWVVCDNQESVL